MYIFNSRYLFGLYSPYLFHRMPRILCHILVHILLMWNIMPRAVLKLIIHILPVEYLAQDLLVFLSIITEDSIVFHTVYHNIS